MNRHHNCDWNRCQMRQSPIILTCLIIAIVKYHTHFSVAADENQPDRIEGKICRRFFEIFKLMLSNARKRRRKMHLLNLCDMSANLDILKQHFILIDTHGYVAFGVCLMCIFHKVYSVWHSPTQKWVCVRSFEALFLEYYESECLLIEQSNHVLLLSIVLNCYLADK